MRSAKGYSLVVLIALFGAGCNSPVASGSASPTPGGVPFAQSPEPSSQLAVAPSPRPIPKVLTGYTFPVALKLDCRIPVQLNRATDEKTPPGFLDLTTGHFTSDPSSRVVEVKGSWDDWRTVATPVLRGFNGITYSWSAGRWLPANRWQVAPDGLHYAYPEVITPNRSMRLHVVDLVSGTDRVVSTVPSFVVLDYRSDGLYVAKAGYYAGEGTAGLWRINPTTGSVVQLLPDSATSVNLDGTAAWASEKTIQPTVLYRYDLQTGSRSVWFARPDTQVLYRATDSAGRPLVLTTTWPATDPTATTLHLVLLSSPSKAKLLFSDPWGDVSLGSFPPVRDAHGIWLGSTSGLWLLQPNGTLIKVTAAPVYPLGDCR